MIIKKTLDHLLKGNVILYPTDTSWGIGGASDNDMVVKKIFKIKKRNDNKALICLVSSIKMLDKHVKNIPKKLIKYINSDEPTTVIYQNPKGFAKNTIASDHSIAIRIVKDDFCRKLIKSFGKPIVSTSANISGEDTPKSFSEISSTILDSVDYIVNLHQNTVNTKSSTIVKIVGDTIQVLRA